MKINTFKTEQEATTQKSTFIDPNPVRVREMLDKDGNVIDPRTKVIIRKAEDNK